MTFQPVPQYNSGTDALAGFKAQCEGMWLGWVAYKAGTNFYAIHPDVVEAGIHGAHSLRRWWVWLFWMKMWILLVALAAWLFFINSRSDAEGQAMFDQNPMFDSYLRSLAIFLVPALFGLVITYCRNVDFALFKRRWLYRVTQPIVRPLDRIPNWVLYLLIPCMLFAPI